MGRSSVAISIAAPPIAPGTPPNAPPAPAAVPVVPVSSGPVGGGVVAINQRRGTTGGTGTPSALAGDFGLSGINLSLDEPAVTEPPQASESKDEHWQEVATKLDLAKAYQEMGDQAGAREILEEVVRDGDETQRETAQTLLQQLA